MTTTNEAMASALSGAGWAAALWGIAALILWIFQACLAASLARQKGYSGTVGFLIAFFAPGLGLIYQAGRPISQDMEDERQRALAIRIAKAIRKSEQAQEKVFHSEEEEPVRKKFRGGR